MNFDTVADELYSLPPDRFVEERDARVKQARADGDKDLAGRLATLRKPTAVAWLANQLARELPDEIGPFLDLGESLREATANLSGPQLRELSRQRQQLVTALVRRARSLGGPDRPRVSEDVARGLEETLHAALADPEAAEALRSGRLSTGLTHSGFGPPPASGPAPAAASARAPKATERGAASRRATAEEKRRDAARRKLEAELGTAWAEARRTAEQRDEVAASWAEAKEAYDAANRQVQALDKQLTAARRDRDEKALLRDEARAARDQADRAAQQARRVVTELQAQLDRL